ncbi:MAG: hypothetical protein U1G07_04180 [Verrucomicrobiota bacterium]
MHPARLFGANEKIVVAVMGVGGRGSFLAQRFAERPDIELTYVSMPTSAERKERRGRWKRTRLNDPGVQDLGRVLDDSVWRCW